jgi:RNA polymerase sigma-70 factor, ECF subfamily
MTHGGLIVLNQMPNEPIPLQGEYDPDWALVRSMAQGEVAALNELYARYGGMILAFLTARTGNRQASEELVQDVMLAAWENAARFEARSKVKTWLLVIARNRAINAHRKRQVPIIHLSDVFQTASDDTGPMEAAERRERKDVVREAIKQLPDQQREVLTLVFYHGLSGPEVAEVLGISEGTVKSRLFRAKEALRRVLSGQGDL